MPVSFEEVEEKVLEVIQYHRTDIDTHFGVQKPINKDSILYVYGSLGEFEDITSDLEDWFDISLSEDIGEMTVDQYIDHVHKISNEM